MKPKIHPEYKELKVTIGKDTFITNSTIKSGEILMDIDYRTHPAWVKDGSNVINQSNKNITNFNKRFGSISFGKPVNKTDTTNSDNK